MYRNTEEEALIEEFLKVTKQEKLDFRKSRAYIYPNNEHDYRYAVFSVMCQLDKLESEFSEECKAKRTYGKVKRRLEDSDDWYGWIAQVFPGDDVDVLVEPGFFSALFLGEKPYYAKPDVYRMTHYKVICFDHYNGAIRWTRVPKRDFMVKDRISDIDLDSLTFREFLIHSYATSGLSYKPGSDSSRAKHHY